MRGSWQKYSCTSLHTFSMRYGGTLLGLFSVTWMAPARQHRGRRRHNTSVEIHARYTDAAGTGQV